MLLHNYFFWVYNQYIKPRAQILAYDSEDILEFLNSQNQKHTFDHLVEIRNQGTLEEAEDPELQH
jgi:hypothetical protein